MRWKRARLLRVKKREIQRDEVLLLYTRFQIARSLQLPQRPLDGNLPAADRADKDLVLCIALNGLKSVSDDSVYRGSVRPPQQNGVSIQQ